MADTTLGLILDENDPGTCTGEEARELAEVGAVADPDGPTITLACGATSNITQASFDALLAAGIIDSSGNVVGDFGNTAVATATMRPVTAAVVARGSGYITGLELTFVGGTFTTPGVAIVAAVSTVSGQDETAYGGGETAGSFGGGTGHAVNDNITLSDGTVVTVDAEAAGVVTEFTVTTPSTSGSANGTLLSQTGTDGSGVNFSLSQAADNQGVFGASLKETAEVPIGEYSALPTDPVATSPGAGGSGATFNVDWGVRNVTVTEGGEGYTSTPAVSFTGGAGTTAVSAITGDAVTSVTVGDAGSGYSDIAGVVIAAPPG